MHDSRVEIVNARDCSKSRSNVFGFLVVQYDPSAGVGRNIGTTAEFIKGVNNVGLLPTLHTNVGVPVSHRRLGDDAEDFASVDGLACLGQNAFHRAALGRADFVLHLHGFNN